jgi:hypothetical protein
VLAPLGFIVANEIILFAGWAVVWKLVFAIVIGFILLAISSATSSPERRPSLDWRSGTWVWPYVLGLGVISYYGSFGPADRLPIVLLKGAKGDLPYGIDILVMALFSLAIYGLAMWLRLPSERVHEYVGDLTAEAAEEEAIIGDAIPAKGH